MNLLKIGEIAKRTGKSVRAIRFYEELGLIGSAEHTKGGFRLFNEDAVRRMQLVDKFHQLGFPLEEIATIVSAYRCGTGDEAHHTLKPLLERSLKTINDKIALLEDFRKEVQSSLRFVCDCERCEQKPNQEKCMGCSRGTHQPGSVPFFIDKIL